jgi:pyruvate-formate lyase-activating enzyme
VDLLLFDYKLSASEGHRHYTGAPNAAILENLDAAYRRGVPIILRCPIVPGINDTHEHFSAIYDLDQKYPRLQGIELLPYHPLGNSKRRSTGLPNTLCHLGPVESETAQHWIARLQQLGCQKAKIG